MTLEQKKTPGDQTRGIPENHHSHREDVTSSIADNREFFAQILDGVYVVVAEIQCESGKRFRRRFYANLPSAQRHVDRARMNGKEAHLFIGQITIIDGGDPR